MIGAGQIGLRDDDVGELFCVCGCGAVMEVGGKCVTLTKKSFFPYSGIGNDVSRLDAQMPHSVPLTGA